MPPTRQGQTNHFNRMEQKNNKQRKDISAVFLLSAVKAVLEFSPYLRRDLHHAAELDSFNGKIYSKLCLEDNDLFQVPDDASGAEVSGPSCLYPPLSVRFYI